MNPTDKRIQALASFTAHCDMSRFTYVLLTGSMVFGKYHSVTDKSDIDLIFVTEPDEIVRVQEYAPFSQMSINSGLIDAFMSKRIDRFWLEYMFDDVVFNIGVWSAQFLEEFLSLKANVHRLGSLNDNVHEVAAVDMSGRPFVYTPELERYTSIFIKQFPLIVGDAVISSPSYCNLIASEVIYDPQNSWERKIEMLISELNTAYGSTWFEGFLAYVVQKSSPGYLAELRRRATLKQQV